MATIDFLTRIANLESRNASHTDSPANVVANAVGLKEGRMRIRKASVAALTLAAPIAGPQRDGGDDGRELTILSTTAFAHTVTTPSNVINGNKAVATFAAAVGNFIRLIADNGVWVMEAQQGITLT